MKTKQVFVLCILRALTAAKAFAQFYVRRMGNMEVASVTVRTVGRVPSVIYPLGIAKFPIATNMASAYEVHASAILDGKDPFVPNVSHDFIYLFIFPYRKITLFLH